MESFVSILTNVFPAVGEASGMYRDLLPNARHFHVDTCEGHRGFDEVGRPYAAMANDRRFFLLDSIRRMLRSVSWSPATAIGTPSCSRTWPARSTT